VSQKLASSDENKEVKDIRNKKVIDNPKHIQSDEKRKGWRKKESCYFATKQFWYDEKEKVEEIMKFVNATKQAWSDEKRLKK